MKLTDEVEEIFIKHFADDDKRKAMKYLKPTQRKESHAVTFFIGNLILSDMCLKLLKLMYLISTFLIRYVKTCIIMFRK